MNSQNLPAAADAADDSGLTCPLCRAPNRCALAAPLLRDGDPTAPRRCWCMQVAIDPALLERLAWPGRRGACLCAACLGAGPSTTSR